MSYSDGRARRAFEIVEHYVDEKISHDVPPDMVHRQTEVVVNWATGNHTFNKRNLLGWLVYAEGDKCIVALEDGGILEGSLKIWSILLRRNRKDASSYGYWRLHRRDQLKLVSPLIYKRDMNAELANAIIANLDSNVFT